MKKTYIVHVQYSILYTRVNLYFAASTVYVMKERQLRVGDLGGGGVKHFNSVVGLQPTCTGNKIGFYLKCKNRFKIIHPNPPLLFL